MDALIFVLWGAFLCAPAAAISGYVVLRFWRPTLYRPIVILFGVLLLAIASGLLLHLRLYPRALEVWILVFAYLALCFLLTLSFLIRPRGFRIACATLAFAPILAGYALGPIGTILFMFDVDEWTSAPIHVERTDGGLVCRVTTWGMVATDEGYTVHLFKPWRFIPVVETEVVAIIVDETDPGDGPTAASCSDAVKRYSSQLTVGAGARVASSADVGAGR
jgi:hypothetical protein